MMDALDIPCNVYWLDRPWAKGKIGYDDFEWDPNRFPNIEKMISWLAKKDIKTLLWIAPWVSGNMAKEAVAKGYNTIGQDFKPQLPNVDFTNPAAKKWWQEQGLKKVLDIGIAGWKLDRADESTPAKWDYFVYDGRATREIRNDYPRQFINATWEISKKQRGNDFVAMARAGICRKQQVRCVLGRGHSRGRVRIASGDNRVPEGGYHRFPDLGNGHGRISRQFRQGERRAMACV